MSLTPMDIHHKEFKSARFGGYNEEDVDLFLDVVAEEFEKLIQENNDNNIQAEHLKKRLSEFEEMQMSLQTALLAASKSAEAVKEQAGQESEALISKTRQESESLIRGAQEQARHMLIAAQNDCRKIERATMELQEVKKRYLESIKKRANAQLEQISEWESRDDAEGVVVEEAVLEVAPPAAVEPPPLVEPPAREVTAQPPANAQPAPVADKPSETAALTPPTLEEAPLPEAKPQVEQRVIDRTPEAPVAREAIASPNAPPPARGNERPAPGTPELARETNMPEEKAAPPSSRLVDEVLAIDSADESVFGELDNAAPFDDPEKGHRIRKDKRDKHFFWE
ncbi:MAG: hypothetical protein CVT63_01825 [Candidatus Anoxymicrobium japonicum]|uniref:Cell wall synthesis protein Wag31 n=1 Tax=Candidatus Anoxymicrobium japonicum TaxID=2013648 RepID=A0A2N3G7B9_9ACTN|nr:MAG: hypothetical protein CVT63_01825 [Candidatus Anoxymicrobium japonicum]